MNGKISEDYFFYQTLSIHISTRVGVKTGLANYLAELVHNILFIITGQFLGPVSNAIFLLSFMIKNNY